MMTVILKTAAIVAVSLIVLVMAGLLISPLIDGQSSLTVLNRGRAAVAQVVLAENGSSRRHRLGQVAAGDSVRFAIKGLGEGYFTGLVTREGGVTDSVRFPSQVSSGMGIDDTLIVDDTTVVLHRLTPQRVRGDPTR